MHFGEVANDVLETTAQWILNMNQLVQERCNSIANTHELHISSTKPSIWYNFVCYNMVHLF